jgi:hypothetical protein
MINTQLRTAWWDRLLIRLQQRALQLIVPRG